MGDEQGQHVIRLFSTDLDGTLLGNPAATTRFRNLWNGVEMSQRPLLCYNSVRLIEDIDRLAGEGQIPSPDYMIGGVGTEIVDYRNKAVLGAWTDHICDGWDLAVIEEVLQHIPDIRKQSLDCQNPFKSSWILPQVDQQLIEHIEEDLAKRGVKAHVICSASQDLDVLPVRADKGQALAWLCEYIGVGLDTVLVAGDRGNDSSMYLLPGARGILVENAQPELFESTVGCPVYRSDHLMAEGIIDGLDHFGILDLSSEQRLPAAPIEVDPELRLLFDPSLLAHLDQDQCELLGTAYGKALEALRHNITPLGFSACCLERNEVTGTDVNYRSVWGRDGSISVIHSIFVNDEDIRTCQQQTLRTLLDNTTPSGQVPANVRIDTGEPDYSGVGGIAAIDSGLWLVIAVYNYVNVTDDLEFLHRYMPTLRRIMAWMQALDSNRDGLIEVPEASDWTDLFGRSYNVLYDELLWFRANVCFGHLLGMHEDHEESAEFMHQSQIISGKILRTFWPTTHRQEETIEATFADRQFSIGDARYLVAEVSPFSFNWRCDVFGNILGFLFNVLDVTKARTALAFMWGVGVNDPWPVANLYPVVQAGDPDWRAYYTVNLLNLPNHYHNGGIWPFVGGMWVRFIHRLGQHEVACQELVRLAECCKQGRHYEWEFNEWCHGTTGRPMGKAFQAWSAASFIRTCHELQVIESQEGD